MTSSGATTGRDDSGVASRIVFRAANTVELEQFDVVDLLPGCLRVRSQYSLMSTGTEGIALRHLFDDNSHWALFARYPFYPGYAVVGVVTEVGDGVEGFTLGQRVVTRAPHASEHVMSALMCTPVPDEVGSSEAAWFAFAKIALMGAWAADLRIGESVAVIGAGPIGQMALRWTLSSGARHAVAVDGFASRLALARQGGATAVVSDVLPASRDAVIELCGGRPDVVIDSTGNAEVFAEALVLAADGGRVVVLGDTGSPHSQRLTADVITRNLHVVGAHDTNSMKDPGWDGDRALHELFFDLVRRGRFNVENLNTHTFAPADCVAAYDLATQRRGDTMGVLFDWAQEP
jgi:2-desacetyl-2-hydroxyethyl bacteriochlorophyllide A dehydrogenase